MLKRFVRVTITIGLLIVLGAVGFGYYLYQDAGRDHTGVALEAPTGEPQVQAAPQNWAAEQSKRVDDKQAYLAKHNVAYEWFTRFPFSEVDGIPLVILKLLPEVAPDIWNEGDAFMSEIGLFRDSRYPDRFLPSGVGFSGLSREQPDANIDYTSFTCAACHVGRVNTGQLEPLYIDGGVNSTFNINLFFVNLHKTLASIYGDEQDTDRRKALVTRAVLSALDRVTASSATYFYDDYEWGGKSFDAEYEAKQVALFKQDASDYVSAFVDYTEGFVAGFEVYLGKTYSGYESQMLAGLPGMADATGVSAIHGYEALETTESGRLLATHVLPDSPGLSDYMPVWEQWSRTPEWDESQQQLINGGGQYNGNIPIPMFRNMAASLTMGLKDTDLRIAAFGAELLEGLPATPYPFDVDVGLAKDGETQFARHCAACHQPNNGRVYDELGTSPARSQVINTLLMEGARNQYTSLCTPETTLQLNGQQVTPCAEFKGVSLEGREEVVMRPLDDQRGYSATALKGVWATAPYLHNGSVPTMYHLLMPQSRPARFMKSSLDFDQTNLGFAWETGAEATGYLFDTSEFHAIGNEGHDTDVTIDGVTYQLDWSDDRPGAMAIIEYLKTL